MCVITNKNIVAYSAVIFPFECSSNNYVWLIIFLVMMLSMQLDQNSDLSLSTASWPYMIYTGTAECHNYSLQNG